MHVVGRLDDDAGEVDPDLLDRRERNVELRCGPHLGHRILEPEHGGQAGQRPLEHVAIVRLHRHRLRDGAEREPDDACHGQEADEDASPSSARSWFLLPLRWTAWA